MNLWPIQTPGPLIQVTSVIKEVIMKDTNDRENILPLSSEKDKQKRDMQNEFSQ